MSDVLVCLFFFKQKTAYEMRISDWSSDVCSSDLINHFSGFHTFYPTFASSKGAAPFKTLEDYENNLKRHKEFVTIIDRSISRFREGMAAGVFDTKLTIQNVIDQLNLQLADKPEESPYYAPVLNFPESISEADQARLKSAYRATVTDDLYQAYTRLRDFLTDRKSTRLT